MSYVPPLVNPNAVMPPTSARVRSTPRADTRPLPPYAQPRAGLGMGLETALGKAMMNVPIGMGRGLYRGLVPPTIPWAEKRFLPAQVASAAPYQYVESTRNLWRPGGPKGMGQWAGYGITYPAARLARAAAPVVANNALPLAAGTAGFMVGAALGVSKIALNVAGLAGIGAYGAYRAARTVMSPATMLWAGAGAVGLGQAALGIGKAEFAWRTGPTVDMRNADQRFMDSTYGLTSALSALHGRD